jgi:uncharacterized BrkB/YihY/UPF0761 family membrane protein
MDVHIHHGSIDPLIAGVVALSGIVYAAFCIWLAVRIVNRRERWAKWLFSGTLLTGACAAFAVHELLQPVPPFIFGSLK